MLRPVIDNKEEMIAKEEKLEEENKDDQDKYKPNWIILIEIGSNATIIYTSDLRSYNMNQNYDWFSDDK